MAIDVNASFKEFYKLVQDEAFTGAFATAVTKLTEQYDQWSITEGEKAKLLAEMTAQITVGIVNSSQATALELVTKSATIDHEVTYAQNKAAAEGARKDLIVRQMAGFDDKLRIEKAKSLGEALGLTSNATGSLDANLTASYSDAIGAIVPAVP
ncbi:hypothetical protein WCX49_11705 [Sulfurimonas sp. HSL-1656]|uniref:hypothetical protein n=1 Tax=Thiomicrolovo subterrani TaxID=3131934 RepID=UPI0031F9728A